MGSGIKSWIGHALIVSDYAEGPSSVEFRGHGRMGVDRHSPPCRAMTLVTLSGVTDAATMQKISLWRYSAVNRKTLFAALACGMLVFSMLGCGSNNKLQSITLNAALVNGVAPTSQGGFFTLDGNGGTIQMQAIGNYSNSKTADISNRVTYNVVVDPNFTMDAFGNTLLPPCQAPSCPVPGAPPFTSGTVEFSPTGLITAVEPATCTWVDIAPVVNGVAGTPSWFYVGDYEVTATFEGITSQPVYIPVASSAGNQFYPSGSGNENNPTGACGPTS